MREKKLDYRRICIAFPITKKSLCYILASHIKNKLQIECRTIIYELDKDKVKDIEKILQKKCIFIVGYEGKVSLENCYKLGLANAYKNVDILLINLSQLWDKDKKYFIVGVPKYVRYYSIIFYNPKDSKFLSAIEEILSILLDGTLIDILYQKAVNICDSVENKIGCSIKKIDKTLFQSKLLEKNEIKRLEFLYTSNDEHLQYDLLYEISEDKQELANIISKYNEQIDAESSKRNMKTTSVISQTFIVNGDQVMGNKIDSQFNNNLEGSNIGNFANKIEGNARQLANLHIHQSPNQNLTDAAKEIKDLLDQLDRDYDRNTLTGQAMINAKAIEAIDKNPKLKDRIVNALKEGGSSALEELVDYPAIKILVATLKGFIDVK